MYKLAPWSNNIYSTPIISTLHKYQECKTMPMESFLLQEPFTLPFCTFLSALSLLCFKGAKVAKV